MHKIDFALFDSDWRRGKKSPVKTGKQEIYLWSETFFAVNKKCSSYKSFYSSKIMPWFSHSSTNKALWNVHDSTSLYFTLWSTEHLQYALNYSFLCSLNGSMWNTIWPTQSQGSTRSSGKVMLLLIPHIQNPAVYFPKHCLVMVRIYHVSCLLSWRRRIWIFLCFDWLWPSSIWT